ncbi:VC0807 family protein [Streptomyces sp. NPDC008001]|uniref:VC0807 family protein n=1 Tax=Streptomyces sp. NPDC008001 TaxID=3364804 RepID=UPI0036E53909
MTPHARRALLVPLTVTIALPLALYYVLRAQGAPQWQALLISGAIPAAHAAVTAVRRRHAALFDLLVTALLAVSAATSLVSGDPRVLLLKDAALPAVLGLWITGSLFLARPFAFHFGDHLRRGAAREQAEGAWRDVPAYRQALRNLTLLWGGIQLLDAVLSTVQALVLPVDVVPVIGRIQSFTLLALVAVITVRRSRRFRAEHGISLFGTAGMEGTASAEGRGESPVPQEAEGRA